MNPHPDAKHGSTFAVLEQVRAIAAAPIEASVSLPPACYTDPDIFALELQKIFRREWLCVGRAADIANPGDYITLETPVAHVMSVRQKDGSIATLSRVCRHRGALLGESEGGNARVFVCPYHSWSYDIDGSLRAAPAMGTSSSFDRKACALPRLRTEIWEGFVFCTSDAETPSLASRLATIFERIRPYELSKLRTAFVLNDLWNTNWKVAFENATESYHHLGVHRQTLQPFFPAPGTVCEPGEASYNLHLVPSAEGFNFDRRDGSAPQATQLNAALTESELSQLLVVGIYPGLALVFAGAAVTWFRFEPIDASHTRVRVGWLVPESYLALEDGGHTVQRDRLTLQTILAEDKASCFAVQQGLQAHDAVAGPLSPLERPVAEFARYLARRLLD